MSFLHITGSLQLPGRNRSDPADQNPQTGDSGGPKKHHSPRLPFPYSLQRGKMQNALTANLTYHMPEHTGWRESPSCSSMLETNIGYDQRARLSARIGSPRRLGSDF